MSEQKRKKKTTVVGRGMVKATDAEILEAYSSTGNIWKVAERLGMCGQSVHERLTRMGVKMEGRGVKWTEEETDELAALYAEGFMAGDGKIAAFCEKHNRTRPCVSRKARQLGLAVSPKRRKSQSVCEAVSREAIRRIKEDGHPRGALGMKHSRDTRARLSEKSRTAWANITEEERMRRAEKFVESIKKSGGWRRGQNAYSRTKSGKRADLDNQFFRSGTEANFARYLRFVGAKYEYEPREFIFHDIRRGVIGYTPDFYIPDQDIFYEVKGWLDDKSITRLKRFKKRYPGEFSKTYIVKERLSKKDTEALLNKIGFRPEQIIDFKSISKHKYLIEGWE